MGSAEVSGSAGTGGTTSAAGGTGVVPHRPQMSKAIIKSTIIFPSLKLTGNNQAIVNAAFLQAFSIRFEDSFRRHSAERISL